MRLRAIVAALLLGGLALSGRAHAQLASPGDLAKPHHDLEGISNCTKCHKAGEQLAADKCLSCHTELRERMSKGHGFHGRLGATQKGQCESCHHEHQGQSAKLIDWNGPMERFEHARTGWPLHGKHQGEKCLTCHEPRRLVDADAKALWAKAGRTFLGVGTKCTTCHFDEHRGQVGADCQKCHEEKGWKQTKFNHGETKFPLAGKHKQVTCGKCHQSETDDEKHAAFPPPRANTFLKYAPLAHNRCTDCHQDPHQGRFSSNCESCHTVDGWHVIKNTAEERKFHDKTRFPLKGLHTTVACRECHGPAPGKPARFKGLAHDKCMDCHADAHHGQLDKPACERCHTVEGFHPSRFELEQHQQTRWPLQGAHAAVPCTSCHKTDVKALTAVAAGITPPPAAKGRGKKEKPPKPEKHAAASVQPSSSFNFKMSGPPQKCETCHSDPHGGQFAGVADGCAKCHGVASFADVKFDHQKDSRFPLTGKHQAVQCGTCHRATKAGQPVRYKPLDQACASCHVDQHVGQLGNDCTKCHTTEAWKANGFSHNDGRFTTFKLEGMHGKLQCAKCHPTVEVAPGRTTVRYKPLPRECEGCHSDFHHGEFRGFIP